MDTQTRPCRKPLYQMYARRRLHYVAHFTFLEGERSLFKFLLHVSLAEEAPTECQCCGPVSQS